MINRYKNTPIRIDKNKNRYYVSTRYPEIPPSISDVYVLTQVGDRLDKLANNYYQNPLLWWVISRANPNKVRRDGLSLEPGIQIRIPSNIERILNEFENLNSIT